MEFVSRYEGLMPLPDPATMCRGYCEGMGCYPHFKGDNETETEREAWTVEHGRAHQASHLIAALFPHLEVWYWKSVLRDLWTGEYRKCDGWHFIKCLDCNGTGRRINAN